MVYTTVKTFYGRYLVVPTNELSHYTKSGESNDSCNSHLDPKTGKLVRGGWFSPVSFSKG